MEKELAKQGSFYSRKIREISTAYFFLLPSFVAISLFIFVPLGFAFIMSIYANPSVVDLRNAVQYYLDFSHLWWRNLRDFFTASLGDDIGILRDEGIYLIIYLISLVLISSFSYQRIGKKAHNELMSVPLKILIAGLSILLAASVTPLLLNIVTFGLSLVPVAIKLPVEGYRDVLTSNEIEFFRIFFNTVFWTATCVILHVVLGMILAILMNRGGSSAQGVFRGIFILPWAIPSFVSALVWKSFIFNRRQGLLGSVTAQAAAEAAAEGRVNSIVITIADIIGIVLIIAIIVLLLILINQQLSKFIPKESIVLYLVKYFFLVIIFWIGLELIEYFQDLTQLADQAKLSLMQDLTIILILLLLLVVIISLIQNIRIKFSNFHLRTFGFLFGTFLIISAGLLLILLGIFDPVFDAGLNFLQSLGYKVVDIPSISSTFWYTDDVYIFGIRFKMMTFSAILVNVWLGVPFMMVSFLAALQSIPQDLYEAADIDGAGIWSKFRNITFPLLKPTLMTVSLLGIIWTFNLFNIFYILSQNQTGLGNRANYDIFVTFIYEQFNRFNYNAAAALSFTVFVMLVSFSLVYRKLLKAEAIFEGE